MWFNVHLPLGPWVAVNYCMWCCNYPSSCVTVTRLVICWWTCANSLLSHPWLYSHFASCSGYCWATVNDSTPLIVSLDTCSTQLLQFEHVSPWCIASSSGDHVHLGLFEPAQRGISSIVISTSESGVLPHSCPLFLGWYSIFPSLWTHMDPNQVWSSTPCWSIFRPTCCSLWSQRSLMRALMLSSNLSLKWPACLTPEWTAIVFTKRFILSFSDILS